MNKKECNAPLLILSDADKISRVAHITAGAVSILISGTLCGIMVLVLLTTM